MTKHLPAILTIISALAVEAGNVFAFHGLLQQIDSFVIIAIGTITTYLMNPAGRVSDGGSTANLPVAK